MFKSREREEPNIGLICGGLEGKRALALELSSLALQGFVVRTGRAQPRGEASKWECCLRDYSFSGLFQREAKGKSHSFGGSLKKTNLNPKSIYLSRKKSFGPDTSLGQTNHVTS